MNILHMRYAVEVADAGSINKASEVVFVAPPNLSRAIKELEGSLGVTLFDRSSRGVSPTPEGEEFVRYARKILSEIDGLEDMYRSGLPPKRRFSVSVPRASYIADAFVRFSRSVGHEPVEIYYMETNPHHAIQNILTAGYDLGIIRYAENYERYFVTMLREKGLDHELITKFQYLLIMSRRSPLAAKKEIRASDLQDLIEIAHADPFVPSLPLATVRREELSDTIERRIFVFERGSQFSLLSELHETFMWVSPVPEQLLRRYDLVQRKCVDDRKLYQDVLIHRTGYARSELDERFILEIHASKDRFPI